MDDKTPGYYIVKIEPRTFYNSHGAKCVIDENALLQTLDISMNGRDNYGNHNFNCKIKTKEIMKEAFESIEKNEKKKIVIIDFGKERCDPPCEGATKEFVEQTDDRSYKSLADAREKASNGDTRAREFLEIGTNHRNVVDSDGESYVAREWMVEQWVVEISDLVGLLVLLKETGGELRHDRQSSLELGIYVHSWPE